HLAITDIVGKDIQALIYKHLRVGELVYVGEGELAVLARLIQNGSAVLGSELGPSAESAVHPYFDVIGTRGHDLVHFGACMLRCHHLGVGRETVLHRGDPRTSQFTTLLRFAHMNHFVRIGLQCWSPWSLRKAHTGATEARF